MQARDGSARMASIRGPGEGGVDAHPRSRRARRPQHSAARQPGDAVTRQDDPDRHRRPSDRSPSCRAPSIFISSNECFQLEQLPESIIIVGAGYIGMEFASIFAALGVNVTVIHRGDQVLAQFRCGSARRARRSDAKRGITIRIKTDIARIDKDGDGYRVYLQERRQSSRRTGDGRHRQATQHNGRRAAEGRRRARLERPYRGR